MLTETRDRIIFAALATLVAVPIACVVGAMLTDAITVSCSEECSLEARRFDPAHRVESSVEICTMHDANGVCEVHVPVDTSYDVPARWWLAYRQCDGRVHWVGVTERAYLEPATSVRHVHRRWRWEGCLCQ